MTSRRGCFFLISGLFAVLVLGGGVFFILNNAAQNRLERLQALNAPPDVYVTAPETGTVVSPGSFELVQVVAAGPNPIQRIELWWDGVKLDESINENEIVDGFTASFPVQVAEGAHMLVARVVDSDGIIGQSLPLGIYGDPEQVNQTTTTVTMAEEGQTLDQIASTFSLPPSTLQTVNPELPTGSLSAGTQIIIPQPQSNSVEPVLALVAPLENSAIQIPDIPMLEVYELGSDPNTFVTFFGSDSDPKTPPKAPENFRVAVKDCKLIARWDDKTGYSAFYNLWMSDFFLPEKAIGSMSGSEVAGPAWFQMDIPAPGNYGFWLEASNSWGKQKSPIIWLRVENHNCPSQLARHLEFELVELDIAGNWDRAYCYVSAEGVPETRIPPRVDTFYIPGGSVKNQSLVKNIFPIPSDYTLNLAGECWKVQGMLWEKIGNFTEAIPSTSWDGSKRPLSVGISNIWYTVKPLGELFPKTQYAFPAPHLTPPRFLGQKASGAYVGSLDPSYDAQRLLTWEWKGYFQIEGFRLYMDDVAIQTLAPNQRSAFVWLPTRCGKEYRFEISAIVIGSESARSTLIYKQPDCPYQVTVDYVELFLDHADDDIGDDPKPYCSNDSLDAYFKFWASFNGAPAIERKYNYDSNIKYAMSCGLWKLDVLTGGTDEITTTLAPSGTTISYSVGALFVDDDDISSDDIFADPELSFMVWAPDAGQIADNTHVIPFETTDGRGWLKVHVTIKQWTP